jgi:hypothetical protein
LDDGYWPCFTTVKSRSTQAQWESVGEGFVKELDFGRVWLRLNEADEGEKDDIIGEWKSDTKAFLQSSLVRTSWFVDVTVELIAVYFRTDLKSSLFVVKMKEPPL